MIELNLLHDFIIQIANSDYYTVEIQQYLINCRIKLIEIELSDVSPPMPKKLTDLQKAWLMRPIWQVSVRWFQFARSNSFDVEPHKLAKTQRLSGSVTVTSAHQIARGEIKNTLIKHHQRHDPRSFSLMAREIRCYSLLRCRSIKPEVKVVKWGKTYFQH